MRRIICDPGFYYNSVDFFITCSYGGRWRYSGFCVPQYNAVTEPINIFQPIPVLSELTPTSRMAVQESTQPIVAFTQPPSTDGDDDDGKEREEIEKELKIYKDFHHCIIVFIVLGVLAILILTYFIIRPFIMEDLCQSL